MDKETKTNVIETAFQRIQLPSFEETCFSNKPYVRYGEGNSFPTFLQDLANRSALHNAILSSKVDYSYADGLKLSDEKPNLSTTLFVNHPNPFEDMNSIYRKCLYDYILYGAFCLNVIWSNDGESICEIYHIDVAKIRSGKRNSRGIVEEYFYCEDWNKTAPRYKAVSAYRNDNRQGSQLLYFKEYRPGTFYYALPSYVGALNYITIDAEISNYHLAHLLNGMSPNFIISFTNGVPSDEERRKIKQQMIDEYTGTDNAGKFIMTFTDDPAKVPVVNTLSADNLDEQFTQLSEQVLQNILSGHKVVSPMLVGIKSAGQLGGNTELETSFEIFNNTVIKPIQKDVIGQLNKLLRETKNWSGNELEPTTAAPISFTWSEGTLSQILTVDEMRERIGLEPTTEENITFEQS